MRPCKQAAVVITKLRPLLENRPASFALSMLPSAQQAASEKARVMEEKSCMTVEQERLRVREARWEYFQAALQRDQVILQQIASAPEKVEALRHRKEMQFRMEQAQAGEKVVKSYLEKYAKCIVVQKMEHAQQKINDFRTFVATQLILTSFCCYFANSERVDGRLGCLHFDLSWGGKT